MTLTVLNVAYPLAPVGPDAVGGAEQILSHLDRALVAAGGRSLVIAQEKSDTAGELIPIPRVLGQLTDAARQHGQHEVRSRLREVLSERGVDVIHLHGIDCYEYLPETDVPVLVTLHLPLDWYPPQLFEARPGVYLHCVSASQQAACPAGANLLPPIPNGVDLAQLHPCRSKRGFAMTLSRVCPEKGLHHALEAAKRADVPLLLAGEVFAYESHVRYFETEIAPSLDARRRFIGPLPLRRKRRLLAAARCLLIPSLVQETSSLAAMEALACGTPVIAFPSGALPEVVEHGRTGFVVRNTDEMAQAVADIDAIDAGLCRETARLRFSSAEMCRRYLDRYRELADRHPRQTARALRIEEITTHARLESLAPQWWDLWRQSPAATPFQSPAWLIPWARHFPPQQLWTLAVFKGDELVGLAPLFIHAEPGRPPILLLLGAGNSDYLDMLAAPEHAVRVARLILRRIQDSTLPWQSCRLTQLPGNSVLLGPEVQSHWPGECQPSESCPAVQLPEGAELRDCIPPEQWRKLAYSRRRAAREGTIRVETAHRSNFEKLFAEWLQLHAARWSARDEPGVLADSSVREFHRESAAAMLDRGLLRLRVLRLESRPLAAFYGFCDRRTT
jgi:glycosyltransferase involved in cell wall biosynthesis